MEREIAKRSDGKCELCASTEALEIHVVSPKNGDSIEECAHLCGVSTPQVKEEVDLDPNHWRCLNDSMWSEVDAVKVLAWRLLNSLKSEGWPNDLLEMMYLEEDTLKWARSTGEGDEDAIKIIHKDVNGVTLEAGDSVVLIKDLNVKGGGFTAKRGTAVRGISLDPDNANYIEGRVEGQMIVIITEYVKKQ